MDLDQVDEHVGTGIVYGLVIVAWISRRCDAFLVMGLFSMLVTMGTVPVMDELVQVAGPYLPGVQKRADLVWVASWLMQKLGMQPNVAYGLCGIAVVLVSVVLGFFISRKSPVVGTVLYILSFTVNAQSGFFDDYPVRLVVPAVLLGLSIYSKHLRYLNLASMVFAFGLLASNEPTDEPPLLKDIAPIALWAGFAINILHDILVRLRIVEWTALVFESAVLVFVFVVGLRFVLTRTHGLRFGVLDKFLDSSLTWPEIAKLDCLPSCGVKLECSIPGMFGTVFCIVTILRNIVGRRASLWKSVLSTIIVIGASVGATIHFKHQHLLLEPNFTVVIAALALFASEQVASIKGGFGNKDSALSPPAQKVDLHLLIYYHSRKGQGSTSKSDEGTQKHVAFSDSTNTMPTEGQVEEQWQIVQYYFDQLNKAKATEKKYKDMLFRQEATIAGLRGTDEASLEAKHKAKTRVDQLELKLREANNDVKVLQKKKDKHEAKAKEMEQKIQKKKTK